MDSPSGDAAAAAEATATGWYLHCLPKNM